jgi:hypothetical protein
LNIEKRKKVLPEEMPLATKVTKCRQTYCRQLGVTKSDSGAADNISA